MAGSWARKAWAWEADIDEAGSGGGGFRHIRVRGEGFDDDGGDLRRLAAGGLGGDQGGVGGHVAMGGVAVRGDLDAVGDVPAAGRGWRRAGRRRWRRAGRHRGSWSRRLGPMRRVGDREPGAARHGAKGPAAMPQFARPAMHRAAMVPCGAVRSVARGLWASSTGEETLKPFSAQAASCLTRVSVIVAGPWANCSGQTYFAVTALPEGRVRPSSARRPGNWACW